MSSHAERMDKMIDASHRYKTELRRQGKLDEFNRIVGPAPAAKENMTTPEPHTHNSYCVKCKGKKVVETKKVHSKDPAKAGRIEGTCPDCGTSTHTFMSAEKTKQVSDALQSTLAQTGGK